GDCGGQAGGAVVEPVADPAGPGGRVVAAELGGHPGQAVDVQGDAGVLAVVRSDDHRGVHRQGEEPRPVRGEAETAGGEAVAAGGDQVQWVVSAAGVDQDIGQG